MSIDETGISPDVQVLLTGKDYENVFDRQRKAAEIILQDQIAMTGTLQDLKQKYIINTFNTLTKE